MKLQVREDKEVTVITPSGSLVLGPSEDAMKQQLTQLIDAGRTRLIIDLSGLKRIDSSGIECLLVISQHARDHGGDARLARVPKRFQTLIDIAHLSGVLHVYPDVADAVSSYTRRP